MDGCPQGGQQRRSPGQPGAAAFCFRSALAYNPDVIEFSGVSFRSGDSTLLQDFSWQLPDPGIYLLLGGNGTGKSLLRDLLSGRARPTAGRIEIMGETARHAGGQVWAADAAVAIRDEESVEEYVEYELAGSGASGAAVDDCLGLVRDHIHCSADQSLSSLPHHMLLLVQVAIAISVDSPLRILDGHLTYLDERNCKTASQMMQGFTVRQDDYLLVTASRVAAPLPDINDSWLLSRELPVRVTRISSPEGISTDMQRVSSSTAISVYYRNANLSPNELTSGESYRVLSRLEGGLNLELSGSIDDCLAELAARGIDIRRIDLQQA